MGPNRIVAIGASAGGIEALQALASQLPSDFAAPICVVVHTAPESPGMLPSILSRSGPLSAEHARDGLRMHVGGFYIAPADYHLMVEPGVLRLTKGPRENRFRPAVDPLFRSAAQVYGPGAIGVVLSGGLDDGTAGLHAIKQLGGTAVVQNPDDAVFPSMPMNAAKHVAIDYCAPIREMGALLTRLVAVPVHEAKRPVPADLEVEVSPNGYLLLGSSESVDGSGDMFATVDKTAHLFQSRPVPARFSVPLTMATSTRQKESRVETERTVDPRQRDRPSYPELHQRLLEQYAPPSVVVNEEHEIVHLSEHAGRYLQFSGGEPSQNILKLVRPEIRLELRTALYQAAHTRTSIEARGLPLRVDDRQVLVDILVKPVLRAEDPARGFFLVLFQESTEGAEGAAAAGVGVRELDRARASARRGADPPQVSAPCHDRTARDAVGGVESVERRAAGDQRRNCDRPPRSSRRARKNCSR